MHENKCPVPTASEIPTQQEIELQLTFKRRRYSLLDSTNRLRKIREFTVAVYSLRPTVYDLFQRMGRT